MQYVESVFLLASSFLQAHVHFTSAFQAADTLSVDRVFVH